VVDLLLRAGADPTLEDWHGANAMDFAASEAVVKLLVPAFVARGAMHARAGVLDYLNERHPVMVSSPGPWDQTPLARAIEWAPEQVGLLLAIGGDPNERLSWGGVDWTPMGLALAAARGDLGTLEVLLSHGADPNARWCVPLPYPGPAHPQKPAPGCSRERGTTPLMYAASLGNPALIRLLIRHGADPHATDWQGRTAADLAPAEDRQQVVRALR
jgi:ankyrin repeat protein